MTDFITVLYTRWRFDNYAQDQKTEYYLPEFIFEKICEILFTFMQHSAELLSFWRDFSHKIQTSNFGLYVTKAASSGNFR